MQIKTTWTVFSQFKDTDRGGQGFCVAHGLDEEEYMVHFTQQQQSSSVLFSREKMVRRARAAAAAFLNFEFQLRHSELCRKNSALYMDG